MSRTVIIMTLLALLILMAEKSIGSEIDELLNMLSEKKVISAEDLNSFRADLAIKQQEEAGNKSAFEVLSGRQLRISGYTNIRYQTTDALTQSFDIRRVRLDIRGELSEKFEYRTQLDAGSTALKLLDASLAYKIDSSFKVILGQFAVPFSLENLTSNTKLELINRSQAVENLGGRSKDVIGDQNGLDTGLQISGIFGQLEDFNVLEIFAGVFNGSGINKADTNIQKDVAGRVVFKPSKELSIGCSVYEGFANYGSPAKDKVRERIGADLAYIDGSLSLRTEVLVGKDDLIEKNGWYAQAGYFILPKELEAVYRYDLYDPNTVVSAAIDLSGVHTAGVNIFFNKFVFLQLNYEAKTTLMTGVYANSIISQITMQF